MYLTHVNTVLVDGFRAALGPASTNHPVLTGRDLWVGAEFPETEANYPGVWITYDPSEQRRSGLGHTEHDAPGDRLYSRWTFTGAVTVTVVSLLRQDRDALLDEVLRLLAFAHEHPDISDLRKALTTDPLINLRGSFETPRITGVSGGQGTPWGSDQMVFEGSIGFSVEGEFVSNLKVPQSLVPISGFDVIAEATEGHEPPDPPFFDSGQWH